MCWFAIAACAPAARAPVATATANVSHAVEPVSRDADRGAAERDGLYVVLRPVRDPAPAVHVELELRGYEDAANAWRLERGRTDRLSHVIARDEKGELAVALSAVGTGVSLQLERAPTGHVQLSYDVLAGDDAPDDPLGVLVLDDRFRGAGERLVAAPEALGEKPMKIAVHIDGAPLQLAAGASSLGVGPVQMATLPTRALQRATFIAGSLGRQVVDDPGTGHDEGAWLGYTAFDPRLAVAELAAVRTAMHEVFRVQSGDPFTYLVVAQTRPLGSFSVSSRWASVLLQVGPAEPWGAPLRLAMAQQLARRWIGGQLRIAAEAEREAESWWFADGVSRYVATTVLARMGLLTPDEVRDIVAGELGVLATSPRRAARNAALAESAAHDDTARAVLMARGALYAVAESAAIRARSKGERGLDSVLARLVQDLGDKKQTAMAVSTWLETVGREDPDAAGRYAAFIERGDPVALPADALGTCFRASPGEYVSYDPGFDVDATRASLEGRAIGVRPDGPAAKAGLKDGDLVDSIAGRDGDAGTPMTISVRRAGAAIAIKYSPRGARGRGQTWARVPSPHTIDCMPPL